ncbi:glycoside hydrolase family 1 protein, partial [Clostridium polynesiense]|uniref:glycoside hydrolase family 1 protein n=1 Tax=Clostridium polynesiense TaxID=1325933 RepID=UPI00058F36BD
EKGGWESREVVEAYTYYAETAFMLFGDLVKRWVTFNEPIVPVEAGYLYKQHYPCVTDMKRAVQVAYNTMIASASAIKSFRVSKREGEIGIILNLTPSYPRSEEKADKEAADLADLLSNRSFLDPSVKGSYPDKLIDFIKYNGLAPEVHQGDSELIKENTVDFLGVNYYQPRRIKAKEDRSEKITHGSCNESLMPESFMDNYIWPERRMNPYRGWEIYEKGIYDIGINIRDNYHNIPWFVSENGMGVQDEERFIDESLMINDDYRIDFIKEHLKWLHKTIEEGSNCFGYHLWTFMDNWSWCNAYKNRYGLYRVNLKDDFKRSPKKSALWYREVIKNNGF